MYICTDLSRIADDELITTTLDTNIISISPNDIHINYYNPRRLMTKKSYKDNIECEFEHALSGEINKTMTVNPKLGPICSLSVDEGLIPHDTYITRINTIIPGSTIIISELQGTKTPTMAPVQQSLGTNSPTSAPTEIKEITCEFKHVNSDTIVKTMTIQPTLGQICIFTKNEGLKPGHEYTVAITSKAGYNALQYTIYCPTYNPTGMHYYFYIIIYPCMLLLLIYDIII